jgi:hypothetical protein
VDDNKKVIAVLPIAGLAAQPHKSWLFQMKQMAFFLQENASWR